MTKLTSFIVILFSLLVVAQVNEAGFIRKITKPFERVVKNVVVRPFQDVVLNPLGKVLRPIVQLLPVKRRSEPVPEAEVNHNPASLPVVPESFETGMVRLHNELRNMEHVPGQVAWDQPLAEMARQWAVQCNLVYPVFGDYRDYFGQNIFAATSPTAEPINAINTWYSYKANFNPASGDCIPGTVCSPYIQAVLPESNFVGCAQVTCPAFVNAQTKASGSMIFCMYAPS